MPPFVWWHCSGLNCNEAITQRTRNDHEAILYHCRGLTTKPLPKPLPKQLLKPVLNLDQLLDQLLAQLILD